MRTPYSFCWLLLPLLLLIAACGKGSSDSPPDPTPAPGYQLVWADEFNGAELDTNAWNIYRGHWGGQTLQYYSNRPKNVRVEGGNLVLELHREAMNGWPYTSGRVTTRHKKFFQYGRMEVRVKLPVGQGVWPALWMLPEEEKYGPWPNSGEIDLIELQGNQPDTLFSTVHWGQTADNKKQLKGRYGLRSGSFADDFHILRMDWDSTALRFYTDGNLHHTVLRADITRFTYPFDNAFYFIFNVSTNLGTNGGAPDNTTPFPGRMEVDWVRVYQKR